MKIHSKDFGALPFIYPEYPANGELFHLPEFNNAFTKECCASFSIKNNLLKLSINGDDPNFFKSKYNNKKHSLHLENKSNCISFYILPSNKSNFFKFTATTDNQKKAVYYYSKLKNKKYKPQKNKAIKWSSEFQIIESDNTMMWVFSIVIPLKDIKILPKNILGSKFLLVKYSYSDCNSNPRISNSMRLPKYQISNPKKWNVISDSKNKNTEDKSHKDLEEVIKMENDKREKERIIYDKKILDSYVNNLDKLYELVDDDRYDRTFQMLERIVNIPEFWSEEFNIISYINENLDTFIKSSNLNNIITIVLIVDAIMKGTEHWTEHDLDEFADSKNKQEGQRLREAKNPNDKSQYHPCFIEIKKKEKAGITYGRKGPTRYIYEECEKKCNNNWLISYEGFRKKYAKWEKERGDSQENSSKQCKYDNKCSEW